jgi:hypothetical protein
MRFAPRTVRDPACEHRPVLRSHADSGAGPCTWCGGFPAAAAAYHLPSGGEPTAATSATATVRRVQDFVVITGFSGAGKSQAMACFEDAGYFCVDNLPPEMIGQLADLFGHEGSKVERAAIVSDVRGGE